ncbi:MAG: glycerophosphodiester phosphodiesterase [Clostridiales bacterium]|nr:glycerophosphodiester phosphodiesterase [Clostridiales bacterium]
MGIAALVILYFYIIAPSHRHPDADKLLGKLYAHRGLHDGNRQVIENSMKAFSLAVDGGYGIELDVQLTRDNQLVVHHDASTARICGADRIITQTDYADLPSLPDGSPIPLFTDLLALVAGRVPLVVEIKSHGDHDKTAAAALAHLRVYQGPFCVESFHPQIVRYVRLYAPDVIRGQLASGKPYTGKAKSYISHFTHKHLLHNFRGRPHFIAYDCKHRASPSLLLAKSLFGAFLVAWTIKDQPLLDKARRRYASWIFEGFTPKQ